MILELLVIGVLSILGQVVLLRELNVALYGIELIYIIALGFWLWWTATGAWLGRSRLLNPTRSRIHYLFILSGIVVPLDVAFIRGSHLLFGGVPGAYLAFPTQLLIIFLALLPVGLVMGILFQWAARLYSEKRGTLALAYGIEGAGGVIGGLASTLFLVWGVQNFTIALVCSLIAMSIVPGRYIFAKTPSNKINPVAGWSSGVLLVLLIPAFIQTGYFDRSLTGWNHPYLVSTLDTPYSRVSVTRHEAQLAVFENNALAYETGGTAAEEFVHTALTQHPGPSKVLLLGGGFEGNVAEILKHFPPETESTEHSLEYVELNRELLRQVKELLPEELLKPLVSGSVRIVYSDPRRYLFKQCRSRKLSPVSYDVILVAMPGPESSQSNRYYTREFFEGCRDLLKSDGILAFRLRSAENFWTPQLTRRMGSIYNGLKQVFAEVVVIPGGTNVFIASEHAFEIDPGLLGSRLTERGVYASRVNPQYLYYLYTNDRFDKTKEMLDNAVTPANTDIRPVSHRYAVMIWLSKFYTSIAFMDDVLSEGKKHNWPWIVSAIAVIVLVILLVTRRYSRAKYCVLVGLAGLLGMIAETVLLLYYQVKSGVLYQNIGLLLMFFMAGLSTGSIVTHYIAEKQSVRILRRYGFLLVLVFILMLLILSVLIGSGVMGGLAVNMTAMLMSGIATAGLFAYAAVRIGTRQEAAASVLYSVDLLGGCIGAVLGSMILVPFFGLQVSALCLAVIALLALLML